MTADDERIAVVGLAGRFPGARDVAALWRALLDGVDAVHDHSDDELRALGIGEELLADPALVRGHGRLADVAGLDAGLFGIPDEDARAMDPQQRLFLEQSWVALQDAGCDPADCQGAVGAFAGASVNRYFLFRLLAGAAADGAADRDWERLLVPGWSADYLPAQVAYRLGLTGPAVAVQTACSSSLVAVCLAAQSLLDYRCDIALAGGASVSEPRFRHGPGSLVSPDGRCRAFDAGGQGSGYGSGAAVLALKRLADARADGDQIYAVLSGWAVNNDGAARAGFAAPGMAGQAAVVAEALASAELRGADIGYVEAHGGGTLVGDAIEVAALAEAWRELGGAGAGPLPTGSCALGSVKTNLGNLDAAAGATGLVKAVLAVRHGVIPGNLHYDSPNPEIDFAATPFFVPVGTTGWPGAHAVRRAGVSSFGLGGTNAHVIVEQPPDAPGRQEPPGLHLLVVSARTPDAVRDATAALSRHLRRSAERLGDVSFTLATRRAFEHRAAVVCHDLTDAVAALNAVLPGQVAGAAGDPDLGRLAQDWVAGRPVDLAPLLGAGDRQRTWLPPYPFQRQRYWTEIGPG
ncbi:MAG: beta-ketoacyl synthase N-terminal-like domain-containing protein [Frankiaceae bacterium]